MKKFVFFLFVCLFAFSLAACNSNRDPAAQNEPEPEHTGQAVSYDIKMELVTYGGIFQMQAATESGCYEIYNHIDGHGKLFYYDFETKTISYVSDQPVPTDDETNPGWIPDLMGGVTPTAAGDFLYLFKRGALPVPSANHPGYEKYIIKMNPDGTDRKFLSLDSWQELSPGEIAFDGKYLYFLVNEYDPSDGLLCRCSLVKADFDRMQLEVLHEFETENLYSLADVYEDGLVFLRNRVTGTSVDIYNTDVPSFENEFVLYSLKENQWTETGLFWPNGSLSCVLDGNTTMYYIETGEPRLYAYDLKTGTTELLCENLNTDGLEIGSAYIWGRILDRHIPFYLSASVESEDGIITEELQYAYDIETGDISKIAFDDLDGLEMTGISIVSETNDAFFVRLGGWYQTTTKISENGGSYTYDELIYEYAMIEKSDYWNSTPNFERFEDTVHAG